MKRQGIEMDQRQDNENEEVKARWKEFWDDHKDFDSAWARNVLHSLSEFLPFAFKFDAVRDGLEELYVKSDVQFPPDFDWSGNWTGAGLDLPAAALGQLPIFRLALALDAYAYYGLKVDEDDFHGLEEFLDDTEEKRHALFPREWGLDEKMEQTITAAFARRKLDHPEKTKGLTPEELAALVCLPRKNIVNLLAPANRGVLKTVKTESQVLITVDSARRWLAARRDFRPSIWRHQSDISFPAPHSEPLINEDPIFVPIASDGTWFSPKDLNSRDNSYHVANGDREEKYQDYWAALEFLSHSKFPRWRYYDATDRWRMKTGTGDDWLRKSRAEIELLLHAIRSATNSIRRKDGKQ
jgi:hypothetical protein